ncbi:spore coat protein GerQ [Brevibacillus sp. B_LB10_24]|uniref:spore coat protein GerQ n=1 Tax=Brevibacillus sp. B_LB10_24 TaxID=3380645 RepID=UPI0038BC58A8
MNAYNPYYGSQGQPFPPFPPSPFGGPGPQQQMIPPSPFGGPGPQQQMIPPGPSGSRIPGTPFPPVEESYIENILRMNLGKMATVYMTFENNSEWNAKIFKGQLEAAGRDHLILVDPDTGMRYLLKMINLDYITFTEPLNYVPPTLPRGIR